MYDEYVKQLVTSNEIPAASLIVKQDGKAVFTRGYGSFNTDNNTQTKVTTKTIFDLASLTKVIATLPSVLLLIEKKEISLDDCVQKYLPLFEYSEVSIRHLLQHTSGLPADLTYKRRNEKRDVLAEINESNLISQPGREVLYSDLGMILLGKIVEKVSGEALHTFCQTNLFIPWKMTSTGFLPEQEKMMYIAPTEEFQQNFIQGEVHDEKAYHLGGVSGSAGLFSNAVDIARYTDYWLFPEKQSILAPETMALACQDVIGNRGLGFEVWSGRGSPLSCGRRWSIGSFGHTGFTGTSVWMDAKEKRAVVFLTNIVHYGRKHRMSEIRKKLHTMIFEN